MLISLSIRDFVLIDRLELKPGPNFTTLTGETGAGKSILLDALLLTLGSPPDRAQIRAGQAEACIAAEFALNAQHPAFARLAAAGIDADAGDTLSLKRLIRETGPARAFINDQPVSASLLSEVGETLIEIHGQHAASALLRPSAHRALLDQFGGHDALLMDTARAHANFASARETERALAESVEVARRQKAWLTDVVGEFNRLAPEPGEAEKLTETRMRLMQSERVTEHVEEADDALAGASFETALSRAARAVEKLVRLPGFEKGEDPLVQSAKAAGEALERALIEAREASAAIFVLHKFASPDTRALEAAEARLFALRALARKHQCAAELLPDVWARYARDLSAAEEGDAQLAIATRATALARKAYAQAAEALTAARQNAAKKLSEAVAKELEPLKLGRARFEVSLRPLSEEDACAHGADRIEFEIETNPGSGLHPLRKIASGGELARVSLALKCALAETGQAGTLIFDEVDQGVGGAVAAAIGERLQRLAKRRQVLAVTHSPQVAASAAAQWRVEKSGKGGLGRTRLVALENAARLEEIARMLSGSQVTAEARAAAGRLLEDA